MLAEIGDIDRFGSARKLAAWAGLTPTVRGSDLTVRHGHISKQGSTWLRWILCEAAQTAMRSPEFAATYQAISHRRGKKIATTAIARKLLTRAYHLLTDTNNNHPPPPGDDCTSPGARPHAPLTHPAHIGAVLPLVTVGGTRPPVDVCGLAVRCPGSIPRSSARVAS